MIAKKLFLSCREDFGGVGNQMRLSLPTIALSPWQTTNFSDRENTPFFITKSLPPELNRENGKEKGTSAELAESREVPISSMNLDSMVEGQPETRNTVRSDDRRSPGREAYSRDSQRAIGPRRTLQLYRTVSSRAVIENLALPEGGKFVTQEYRPENGMRIKVHNGDSATSRLVPVGMRLRLRKPVMHSNIQGSHDTHAASDTKKATSSLNKREEAYHKRSIQPSTQLIRTKSLGASRTISKPSHQNQINTKNLAICDIYTGNGHVKFRS